MGDQRRVPVGDDSKDKYSNNTVKTSKYTPATFLPINLYEQFQKMGNLYFLLISILMYIGEHTLLFIGTIKAFSTIGTLAMMMSISGLVALLDDNKRKAADREANAQAAMHVPKGQKAKQRKDWDQVKVGDILVIHEGDEFPADMVPLFCSGEDGQCYVSTANLDGETNLKIKSAAPLAQKALTPSNGNDEQAVLAQLAKLEGAFVEAEAPQTSIHVFTGTYHHNKSTSDPLSATNLLLRGTVLRNTSFCVGVIVYTGKETRMVMNSRKVPLKLSNLERTTNKVMVVVLFTQGLMALFSDMLYLSQKGDYESLWYLPHIKLLLPDGVSYFMTFFVLYSNMMPISLYPTMEFCNSFQTYFIRNDMRMYWKDLNFPAGCRSSNLCQEIGQVAYVFSDKTGTLTQNIMELKKIWIGGRTFGEMTATKGFSAGKELAEAKDTDKGLEKTINSFLEVLAVSHTCMVSQTKEGDGSIKYDAESPDESALVETAADLGWVFTSRVGAKAVVTYKEIGKNKAQPPKKLEYEILATNAFNSDRKRMSVLVKQGQEYSLLIKGADNVMKKRATKNTKHEELDKLLTDFGTEGLRTLLVGKREISQSIAIAWLVKYQEAQRTLTNREAALDKVAEEIEVNLDIVGITAIEDKLQDKVPDTIEKLRVAGIKLWVLTGDKLETARNIGFSAKVLVTGMTIAEIEKPATGGDVASSRELRDWASKLANKQNNDKAVMVTGAALEVILGDIVMKQEFLDMAEACSVVIACRVSPLQKAQMVQLVREGVKPTPVTLAIGDGANDVPMIQEAQVGVGIAGREGRQAVNNSDFAIGQFSYLQRLMLVHGRWNYRRACKFTIFTFWRNAVQVLCIFYYTLISGYSGTSIFEDWIRLSFNFLCSIPVMATGCMDQDIPDLAALSNPRQYAWGRLGLDLNAGKMVGALVSALLHSLIISGLCFLAYPSFDALGTGDYYTFGTVVYVCLVVDMNYRVLFLNYTHNKYTLGAVAASSLGLAVFLCVYPMVQPITYILVSNMYMITYHMARALPFWICVIVVPIVSVNVDFFVLLLGRIFSPEAQEVVELRMNLYRKSDPAPNQPNTTVYSSLLNTADQTDSEPEPAIGNDHGLDVSPFAQQKCTGLPFDNSHVFSRGLSTFAAFFLVMLGLLVKYNAEDIQQLRLQYAGESGPNDPDPWGTLPREVVNAKDCKHGTTCTWSVKVPKTLRPPILVQYHVGPFYQNSNTYIKSEVPQELRGLAVPEATRKLFCSTEHSRVNGEGNDIYPCGMKVMSFFNDTFSVKGVEINKKNIAWDSDLQRFNNPPDYLKRKKTTWLHDLYPTVIGKEEGVKSEDFIVWMRPSAGSSVTKRYGWVEQELKAGQVLEVTVTNDYPVESFKGYKQFIFTEIGAFGARDLGLAYALLGGGFLSLFLVVASQVLLWFSGRSEASATSRSLPSQNLPGPGPGSSQPPL